MKIQTTPNLQLNSQKQNSQNNSKVAFKSAAALNQVLMFLESNAAWGASAVDVTCMGIPRTTVDFTRGPEAGLETARREFSSTAVDASVGALGIGAAYLLSQGLNKEYGIKAHKLLVNDDMLDVLGQTWHNNKSAKNSNEHLHNFLHEIINSTSGFNPDKKDANGCDPKGWVKISDEKTKNKVVDVLSEEINKNGKEISDETRAHLKALLIGETGAEKQFKIEKYEKKIVSSLDSFLDDIYKVSKTFINGKVLKTFTSEKIEKNTFLNRMKKINRNTAIIGLAVTTAIGCSLQPLNIYLTKKKTGKSGFVGVEGREPDKSKGFKFLKVGVAAAACYGIMRTIAKNPLGVLKAVQFKGITPTIPQFKFVYGLTIVSRLIAARDKNELREATIKDSLGFVNWLIIGGFISKLTAMGIEKLPKFKNIGEKFTRYNQLESTTEKGRVIPKWLACSILTREEVLHDALKNNEKYITRLKSGKAMTFKEMMQEAAEYAPEARTKIRYLNRIQIAGYVWSGLALGFGIPKLNIAITKSIEAKRKLKEMENSK